MLVFTAAQGIFWTVMSPVLQDYGTDRPSLEGFKMELLLLSDNYLTHVMLKDSGQLVVSTLPWQHKKKDPPIV